MTIHRFITGLGVGVLLVCAAAVHADPESERETTLIRQIESAPGDDLAATWMLDLAAMRLSCIMRTCDEASVLFGIPTAAQVQAVREAVLSSSDLVERAAAAAAVSVERLEARLIDSDHSPEAARELAAVVEPTLNRLVDVELAVRIPTLRIECATLAAAIVDAASAEQKRNAAHRLITAARPRGIAAEARNRLLAAAVMLRMPGPQHGETARRQLQWVVSNLGKQDGGGDASLDAAAIVRLHMALIRSGRADDSAKLDCPGRGEDWLVDLLLAEATAAAGKSPESLGGLLAVVRKYGPGTAELDSIAEFSALRQSVYKKIGFVTGPGTMWRQMDPEIAFARAWSLTSAAGVPDAEAGALLGEVAASESADAALRARAMWMLASANPQSKWSARLVTEFPGSGLAVVAARALVDSLPNEDAGSPCEATPWKSEAERGDALAAMRIVLAASPSDANIVGRYVRGLIGNGSVPTAAELSAAAAATALLDSASPQREQLRTCVSEAFERALQTPEDAAARDAILRAAAAWYAGFGAEGKARADQLRLERVEAAMVSELEPAATSLTDLRALLGSSLDAPGSASRARLRLAIGIAQRRAGQVQAAFATLRTVAEGFEGDARTEDLARREARMAFWSAWSEMLEILVSSDLAAGESGEVRVQQAQRQHERLELLDPELGGEPWAGRIRAAAGGGGK